MLPNKTSLMEGCSAAVTETESPSQLRPAVNQTICTSLTGEGWREKLEVEAILRTSYWPEEIDDKQLQIGFHKYQRKSKDFRLPVATCWQFTASDRQWRATMTKGFFWLTAAQG